MACCPFHDDKDPSLKFYDQTYFCFGCHEHGDVINFVAKLFQISQFEAAQKLADDFGVPYSHSSKFQQRRSYRPIRPPISPEKQFQMECRNTYLMVCSYLHAAERWKTQYQPSEELNACHPLFTEAIQNIPTAEYFLDSFYNADIGGEKKELLNDFAPLIRRAKEWRQQQKSKTAGRKQETLVR